MAPAETFVWFHFGIWGLNGSANTPGGSDRTREEGSYRGHRQNSIMSLGVRMKNWKLAFAGLSSAVALSACAPGAPNIDKADEATTQSGIIGGSEVKAGSALTKSIVALYDTVQGQLCTGTLLPNNIVVTAAHCMALKPQDLLVIFGTKVDKTAQARRVTGATPHPDYAVHGDDEKDNGDIAVVHFEGTIPSGYQPAQILTDIKKLKDGASVVLAGYGISNGKDKSGAGVLRSVSVKIADAKFSETEVKLDQRQGRGACHGDSGGPAYVAIGGKNYVWGVTSRGVDDMYDLCNQYAVYTSIPAHQEWLQKTSQELIRDAGSKAPSRLASGQ